MPLTEKKKKKKKKLEERVWEDKNLVTRLSLCPTSVPVYILLLLHCKSENAISYKLIPVVAVRSTLFYKFSRKTLRGSLGSIRCQTLEDFESNGFYPYGVGIDEELIVGYENTTELSDEDFSHDFCNGVRTLVYDTPAMPIDRQVKVKVSRMLDELIEKCGIKRPAKWVDFEEASFLVPTPDHDIFKPVGDKEEPCKTT